MSEEIVGTSTTGITELDRNYNEIADLLKKAASDRRRKRTPKALRKPLDVGSGKVVDTVDRPEYQRWLDDNFPGWSVKDVQYTTDFVRKANGAELPFLFHCSLTLVISDHGLARQLPGVGSAAVSSKEMGYDSSTLFRHKRSAALTQAMKVACGWAGAFFDLRADDEERQAHLNSTTSEQDAKFNLLLGEVDPTMHEAVRERWRKQTEASAAQFLMQMEEKINAKKSAINQQ